MSVIGSNILAGASGQGGYFIDRSLRLRSSASAYLSWTPASAGNRKTWTYSIWFKYAGVSTQQMLGGAGTSGNEIYIQFLSTGELQLRQLNSSTQTMLLQTSQVFRDPSAWYHIVIEVDTTQATSSDRIKIYINGSQITAFSTASYYSLNYDSHINNNVAHYFGRRPSSGSLYFDGYLTEINFIDGQALDPTYFGEYNADTGVWQPIKYVGTYGTNGFYLNFSDNSTTTTLGYDYSGNSSNWTANNVSVTSGATYDSMTDVPTLTSEDAANYAVLNVLAKSWSNSGTGTTSNGNLQIAYSSGNWYGHKSTIAVTSGKWYYEVTNVSAGIYAACGISLVTVGAEYSSGIYKYRSNAEIYNTSYASYGATWSTAGDVCGVAFDLDAGTITFYKNGVSQGTAFTGIPTGVYAAEVIVASGTAVANFGATPFAYTPPAGFKSLNTYNLPDSTIVDGSQYFNTVLYTGNTSGASVTGVGFQPDFVWVKNRDVVNNHELIDAVRGGSSALFSNLPNQEATQQRISSFDSDGWTYTTNSNSALANPYVGWTWKANGSGVSNNDGSIASTVSANPTAGFSIVTAAGQNNTSTLTVGHGLGVAPKMLIGKSRNGSGSWSVWHNAIATNELLYLNTPAGKSVDGGTPPAAFTATAADTFTVQNWNRMIGNGVDGVFYCFADVEGFSKFGSYTGNGSTTGDGPFVYTGFRPAFLIVKRTDNSASWNMRDSERNPSNPLNVAIYADDSSEESDWSLYPTDLLSNGFKVRTNAGGTNASGGTYIYMAFAENPFKNALAR